MTASLRTTKVRELMSASDNRPTAVLFTDLHDIRWLTGFTGSNAWLLVRHDEQLLLTDGRYVEQAGRELLEHQSPASVVECRTASAMIESLSRVLRPDDSVWFQSTHMTFASHASLASSLRCALVAAPPDLARIRRTKDDVEISRIERACRIADTALAECIGLIGTRCTERDLRDELDHRMRRLGAEGPSYDTIVATGPTNSAMPHHRPDGTVIESGHSLVIDVGALVDGYHSDMTRSFLIGEISPELAAMYDLVLTSHLAGMSRVRAGVPVAEVHAACLEVFAEAGMAEYFVHGTGHGVGLVIHEEPFVNSVSEAVLRAGDVVTVEPGLYRVGLGGIRVEDLVVVTDTGCRPLNISAKEPTCPPSPPTT